MVEVMKMEVDAAGETVERRGSERPAGVGLEQDLSDEDRNSLAGLIRELQDESAALKEEVGRLTLERLKLVEHARRVEDRAATLRKQGQDERSDEVVEQARKYREPSDQIRNDMTKAETDSRRAQEDLAIASREYQTRKYIANGKPGQVRSRLNERTRRREERGRNAKMRVELAKGQ
jgi:hypothetical protein